MADPKPDNKASDAVEFLRRSQDADNDNRTKALVDLQFVNGDQWPAYAMASRGLERPQLTINEIASYIRQVTNNQKQQRPRIKAQPTNDQADVKVAKVITGLIRHIQVNSNADTAFDTAFEYGAKMGWGYWRLLAKYVDDKSFDQEIYIETINNPFSVYFDPNSTLLDGSDAQECLYTDLIPKKDFERMYPGADMGSFNERSTGDSNSDWVTEHDIRLAEYYRVEKIKAKLIRLSDGTSLYEDEMPPMELLRKAGISVVGDRESIKRKVMWRKQTGFQVLEEKELPGKWIPMIPFYWNRTWIDGRKIIKGITRDAIDPQRMVNFWNTAITESLALAPKAKWLMAEGQDEGHENEWKNANLAPNPVLRYKTTDIDGKDVPPPERVQPEPPPTGAMEALMGASQNLQRVIGMFDPAVRAQTDKSGKAINAERSQAENSNFHGYDNLTVSMRHTGRVILSWIPTYYDTQRVQRIIGDDGKADLVTLNEQGTKQDPQTGNPITTVLNDVTVGEYDVVMETGPGYDTKRQEGVDSMMQLMDTPIGEKVAQVGDDLLVRWMDFPGADVLADRLAASNPLSQIDDKSDIPPQVQMQLKALQQQLQQAGQTIQQLQLEQKYRMSIEQMKQAGQTQRTHMQEVVKAHDIETESQSHQMDVAAEVHTKAHDAALGYKKAIDVEEIRAHLALLLDKLGGDREVKDEAIENAV